MKIETTKEPLQLTQELLYTLKAKLITLLKTVSSLDGQYRQPIEEENEIFTNQDQSDEDTEDEDKKEVLQKDFIKEQKKITFEEQKQLIEQKKNEAQKELLEVIKKLILELSKNFTYEPKRESYFTRGLNIFFGLGQLFSQKKHQEILKEQVFKIKEQLTCWGIKTFICEGEITVSEIEKYNENLVRAYVQFLLQSQKISEKNIQNVIENESGQALVFEYLRDNHLKLWVQKQIEEQQKKQIKQDQERKQKEEEQKRKKEQEDSERGRKEKEERERLQKLDEERIRKFQEQERLLQEEEKQRQEELRKKSQKNEQENKKKQDLNKSKKTEQKEPKKDHKEFEKPVYITQKKFNEWLKEQLLLWAETNVEEKFRRRINEYIINLIHQMITNPPSYWIALQSNKNQQDKFLEWLKKEYLYQEIERLRQEEKKENEKTKNQKNVNNKEDADQLRGILKKIAMLLHPDKLNPIYSDQNISKDDLFSDESNAFDKFKDNLVNNNVLPVGKNEKDSFEGFFEKLINTMNSRFQQRLKQNEPLDKNAIEEWKKTLTEKLEDFRDKTTTTAFKNMASTMLETLENLNFNARGSSTFEKKRPEIKQPEIKIPQPKKQTSVPQKQAKNPEPKKSKQPKKKQIEQHVSQEEILRQKKQLDESYTKIQEDIQVFLEQLRKIETFIENSKNLQELNFVSRFIDTLNVAEKANEFDQRLSELKNSILLKNFEQELVTNFVQNIENMRQEFLQRFDYLKERINENYSHSNNILKFLQKKSEHQKEQELELERQKGHDFDLYIKQKGERGTQKFKKRTHEEEVPESYKKRKMGLQKQEELRTPIKSVKKVQPPILKVPVRKKRPRVGKREMKSLGKTRNDQRTSQPPTRYGFESN